jgi:hypothetical protein
MDALTNISTSKWPVSFAYLDSNVELLVSVTFEVFTAMNLKIMVF